MKHLFLIFMVLCATASAAQADCYADYKAKQDNPLRLHYGVTEVRGECQVDTAESQLRPALQRDGWQLLNILGVFDGSGLEERRNSAGEYFLRY
ncbi:hypothetical protein [Loktanella sp. S4079]|uniref:hypothetical protein n=1 Tax=Loktanella sp. S4079 TaxID=579483 RepID=UPI0005FA5C2B|nr:hypothetical protein [Loktanella sp. S4079]KJZ19500.1 hypothetical protein TW80_11050 [Loktanella sp. S4079]